LRPTGSQFGRMSALVDLLKTETKKGRWSLCVARSVRRSRSGEPVLRVHETGRIHGQSRAAASFLFLKDPPPAFCAEAVAGDRELMRVVRQAVERGGCVERTLKEIRPFRDGAIRR
jgi:hypothetical protein